MANGWLAKFKQARFEPFAPYVSGFHPQLGCNWRNVSVPIPALGRRPFNDEGETFALRPVHLVVFRGTEPDIGALGTPFQTVGFGSAEKARLLVGGM